MRTPGQTPTVRPATLPPMRARAIRSLLIVGLALGLHGGAPVLAQDVSVTATVDAREIPLGETLTMTIMVRGAGMSGVEPSTPSGLTNLELVGGPSTSTQFSFMNGALSSSKSFTWFLAPQAVGAARIPALDVKVGGKIYRTEAIDVTVVQAGSARSPADEGRAAPPARGSISAEDLRIENEVSAQRIYVGQPLVLTTRMISRVRVQDVSAGPDPTLPGFLLEEADTTVIPERVFREGREYQSYVLLRRILTPTSPGKSVIPAESRTIRIRIAGRGPLDSFFSPRTMEVNRSTAPITIEALAPPGAGRPPSFSGAVGTFRMETTADRTEATVGDAVGFKITLSGTGNLKTVAAPELGPSADFRIFDPRIEEKVSGTRPRTYTKSWSYVITPLSGGELGLPPVTFSYFDPEAETYRTLSSPATRLAVKGGKGPGGDGSASAMAARREVQVLQRDIRFLKPLDSPLRTRSTPFHARAAFWAVIALAAVLQPAAWFVLRRGGLQAFVPGGARGRARRRALASLSGGRSDGPADAVRVSASTSQALIAFIAERCSVAAGGLTHEEIRRLLGGHGVPESTREELVAFLEACDRGRFAPEKERQGSPAELRKRARSLVTRLDSEIGSAA